MNKLKLLKKNHNTLFQNSEMSHTRENSFRSMNKTTIQIHGWSVEKLDRLDKTLNQSEGQGENA